MKTTSTCFLAGLALAMFFTSSTVQAHCDSLDGPVIAAARAALAKGDVTPVLMWVKADDEPAIRALFAETLGVRQLSPAAAALADRYFFENLSASIAPVKANPSRVSSPPGVPNPPWSPPIGPWSPAACPV
jgi:hypothetical protein